MSFEQIQNFINGEFVDPQSGEWMDNYNPATGQVYGRLPDSNELDVVLAIQSANKAYSRWCKKSTQYRSDLMYKIADLIDGNLEELAQAESQDQGKPVWLAREVDIPRAAANFRFFAGEILHHKEMATSMDGQALNYTLRQPLGVAGLISPWNLPLYLLTWKIAPALATGNTAVCKPSEVTPATAFLLCEIFQEAGLPSGVCNMVFGRGDRAGATLVSHPSVPIISFTGGTATGEKILTMAAPHFKKTSVELGGKNANIILKDANLDKAIEGSIRSSFLNQGEICLAGSRILVQEEIYDEFLERFVDETKKIKVGDPKDKDNFMGPLVSEAHYKKVMSCIERAGKEQGCCLTGGDRPQLTEEFENGYFLNPTIIGDLSNCSALWQEEIFGPVVTVMGFKYPKDAIKWANNTPYGLSCSLWTESLKKAHKMASEINVGTVWINTWLKRDLRVPFGGTKASGLGREGGDHSIDFFTERKTVCVQL